VVCAQDADYMAQTDDERVHNMQDVDRLAELLSAARYHSLYSLLYIIYSVDSNVKLCWRGRKTLHTLSVKE